MRSVDAERRSAASSTVISPLCNGLSMSRTWIVELQRLARQSARAADYWIVRARPEHLSAVTKIELAAAWLLSGHAPESLLCETTGQEEIQKALRNGQFQSDAIAIEDEGRVWIGEGQVRFKQAIDAHQPS